MNILAFDTSLNKTYLALKINKEVYSKTIESTQDKYHSAYLIKEIVNILEKNNLNPSDINLIATNIGPGSFTGIRVGLTVARAFAQGTNADTIGINSLELISSAYGNETITILDARKNKAYVGNDKKAELIELDEILEILKEYSEDKIITDGKMQEFLNENGINSINFEVDNKNYGEILLKIAEEKFANNIHTKWEGLKPLYIQPPPIHQKKS